MQIRLILLDFDGTLADTRRANTLAYVATLREAGYALTEEEYAAKYFGMRCNEFLTRYGIADPAERDRQPRQHRQRHAPPGDHGRGTAGGEHGCGNLGCGGQRLDRCG